VGGGLGIGVWLYFSQLPYYPVARIATAEQLTYTAFSDEVPGRAACAAANARFVEPLARTCPGCSVVFTRCERKAGAAALRTDRSAGSPHVVVMPGMQILVSGPPALARAACDQIALDVVRQGLKSGRCLPP
jgi:hypothetical protein